MVAKAIEEIGLRIFGTLPPLPNEVSKAQELLDDAPLGTTPLDIARYFFALKESNAEGERYNSEWKKRSNPLIVSFFKEATNNYTGDISDQTKWCSAFVNWCLMRAGYPYTNSVSSGSFRCFGTKSASSTLGEIAVFKNRGEDKPCRGSGHVAFWLGETGNFVEVLGGNQANSIKISRYPKIDFPENTSPWLVSIRTIVQAL